MCFKNKVTDTAEKITITPLTPEVITDKGSQSYKTIREISTAEPLSCMPPIPPHAPGP